MPNTANRRNLKALMDLLSDAHSDITAKAVEASARLLEADTPSDKPPAGRARRNAFDLKVADRKLGEVLELLTAQLSRVARTHAEIKEIQKNLKVS